MDIAALLALLSQLVGDDGNARSAEELAAIETEALTTLRDDLRAGYTAARAQLGTDPTDEQLDALESVTAGIAVAEGQLTARAEAAEAQRIEDERLATERQERLAALDTVGLGAEGGDGTGGEGGSGTGGEGEGGSGEGAGGDAAGAGAGAGAGSGTQASGRPAEPAPRRRQSLDALANGGGSGGSGGTGGDGAGGVGTLLDERPNRVVASAGAFEGVAAGTSLNLYEHDDDLHMLHQAMQVPSPSKRRHYLGKIALNEDSPRVVRASGPTDVEAIVKAIKNTREWRMELATEIASGKLTSLTAAGLKASGGTCVIPMPDFSVNFVGDRGTSFVDMLPTVVEKRPMAFYGDYETRLDQANPWVDGMGTVTASEDEAGYGDPNADPSTVPEGGAPYKGCVHIDCPASSTTELSANYKCVIYGRFQAIAFPEYVRVFDTSTALWWDVYRDTWAITDFVAKATTLGHIITLTATTFDAVKELRVALTRLLAHVRSSRKSPNLRLTVAVPEFLKYQLATGMAYEMDLTGEKIRLSPEQVLAMVAIEGIDIVSYQTESGATTHGGHTVLPYPTTTIPAWPTETRILVMREGAVFRQSSGEASFGLTETLYQTNDYGTFMETFEDLGYRSIDRWVIDLKLCDNGVQGGTATRSC